MKKYNVAIVGAAGYTGGELLRLLINHDYVNSINPLSRSMHGLPITQVHPDLTGDTELIFNSAMSGNEDVIFLCVGHGESGKWLAENKIHSNQLLIDLSQDYRLHRGEFTYGLTEFFGEALKTSKRIANPGCFATLIQLMLVPLAKNNLITSNIEIAATTGSTGAGQKPSEHTHFSRRSNNVSSYKELSHQHLAEINLTLHTMQPNWEGAVNLIPLRGAFTRGIHAVAHLELNHNIDEIIQVFTSTFAESKFVHIVPETPDVKQVVNTNKCFIHLEQVGHRIVITGVLDNLLKGASGQAIQNMNVALGLPETTGLKLKPSAY